MIAPAPAVIAFQHACQTLLGDRAGTIVAFDPATGRLVALVHPALADQAGPPGSIFKLVTAMAAIDRGVAPSGLRMICRGRYTPGDPPGASWPCWRPGGHGALTLEEAIAQSCNVGFYQWGRRAGPAAILDSARRLGLGLPPGRLPLHPHGREAVDLCIGEGARIATTPRQWAGMLGALAEDGRLRTVDWQGGVTGRPVITPAVRRRLLLGMRGAVATGSARSGALPGLEIAGKTGTATYPDGTHRTAAWFLGLAPASRPRLGVVVWLKAGSGFRQAAPIARQVFAAWLKAGRP